MCGWGVLYYWCVSAGLQMDESVDTVMILMYSQFGSASHNSLFGSRFGRGSKLPKRCMHVVQEKESTLMSLFL